MASRVFSRSVRIHVSKGAFSSRARLLVARGRVLTSIPSLFGGFVVAVGLASQVSPPQLSSSSSVAADVAQSDDLFKIGTFESYEECLKLLMDHYEDNYTHHGDLCWRLARVCYNLRQVIPDAAIKKQLANDCARFADEAVDTSPDDFRGHYWAGIAVQTVGEHEGTKYTISRLKEIRSHFEKAAELNPNDGTTFYCIGQWCFSLADLNWMSRKIATAIYGTPPTSTFEEALECFLKAEKVEPGFWNKNTLMIARSYLKMGDKENSKLWARETIKRVCKTPEDGKLEFYSENLKLIENFNIIRTSFERSQRITIKRENVKHACKTPEDGMKLQFYS